ncbi:MAG: hypothetical protein ABJA62_10440 [Luteimonas sp.]
MGRFAITALLLSCPAAWGETPQPNPAASVPADCKAAEYRQLDFWIGRWRVLNTTDKVEYASSSIEPIAHSCGVKETYESPKAPSGPYIGTSYSAFDRKDGHWHQMYVDSNGSVTQYSGGPQDGGMVFEAVGDRAMQRMTYRLQPDASVRQIGQFSTDGGKTWQPGYDYTYQKENNLGR